MHLFKLKKDGKPVGYEKHALLTPDNAIIILHSKHTDWAALGPYNIIVHPAKFISHDEKCPFVCKDKNSKDVFEGDKNIKHDLYHDQFGTIIFDRENLQYKIYFPLTKHKAQIRLDKNLERAENIELIEEKQ